MLTRAELHEMKALSERLHAGPGSREDWANLVALSLIYQGDDTITRIAAQGFDHFLKTAEPIYEGHAFARADFIRIYKRVCEATARVLRDSVH
jgi:hypothetical protein